MTGRLAGKVAVVAGGSRGIGLAIAGRFAGEGARVVIIARNGAVLDRAVAQLQAPGAAGEVSAVQADMTSLADVERAYAQVRAQVGRIDILVAGVGGAQVAPLGAITEDHFDAVFRLNVKSTLLCVQQALPLLSPGASVILMSSSAAARGTPALSVYAAAKAAVRQFARCWMLDLQPRRIRVNVLSPGPTDTPGLAAMSAPGQAPRMLAQFAARNPSGRIARGQDVANAALFLASDEAAFVNGAELAVDGGITQI
jgi:NAD(P)-dependent dehydrogenase (short-subunit alcohol dehydrogenase family)